MKTSETSSRISYRLDYKPKMLIERPYTAEEVVKLQGSYQIYSVADSEPTTLWNKLNSQDFVAGLEHSQGNQAIQEVEVD
jgi:isocitrate lyase